MDQKLIEYKIILCLIDNILNELNRLSKPFKIIFNTPRCIWEGSFPQIHC